MQKFKNVEVWQKRLWVRVDVKKWENLRLSRLGNGIKKAWARFDVENELG